MSLPNILLALSLMQSSAPSAGDLHRLALEARTDSATAIPLLIRAADAYGEEIAAPSSLAERLVLVRNRARLRVALGDLGGAIAELHPWLDHPAIVEERNRLRAEIVWPADDELVAQARIDPESETVARYRRPAYLWTAWLILWAGLAIRTGRRMRRWECVGWAMAIVAVLGSYLVPAGASASSSAAVVAEPGTVRTGNSSEYPTTFHASLPKGVEVEVLSERGNWLWIRLKGGKTGWIERGIVRGTPRRAKNEGKMDAAR